MTIVLRRISDRPNTEPPCSSDQRIKTLNLNFAQQPYPIMATDDGHDLLRKHRRSFAPEDADRSSKRHRHRHGSRNHVEESARDCETADCETAPASSSPILPRSSGTNRRVPNDDVEEGEILEEVDGDIAKLHAQPDAKPWEIGVTGDQDIRSNNANLRHFVRETLLHAKDLKARTQRTVDDKFIGPDDEDEDEACRRSHVGSGIHEDGMGNGLSDAKDGRASTDSLANGHLDHKSSRKDMKRGGEYRGLKGNDKQKDYCDDEELELDGRKVGYCRISSSEGGGEKYGRSRRSRSRERYRSPSRSNGRARDRSCSGSIAEENAHSKRKHTDEQGGLSYADRLKTDYDLDDERMMASRRENRDLVVDKRREHRASYHNREARERDRDRSRDKDVKRDSKMEKEQERNRNMEVDWVLRREKERERSHERYRGNLEEDMREKEDARDRRREKERDRSYETVFERDRRRDKERYRSRDKIRGGERDRDRETAEHADRSWERDQIKERERRDDRRRHKDRDTLNGMDKYMRHEDDYDSRDRHRKHSKQEEIEYHQERKKNPLPVKVYDVNKLQRGQDEQDDLDEKVTLQLPDQEEEDFNRVKEESRRRRDAILEKYKQQQQQVEQNTEKEGIDKQAVEIPPTIPDVLDDVEVETLFSVRKSPLANGNVASDMISGAVGLGEGTPKSERADDKFCDDIFGETPTGVQKSLNKIQSLFSYRLVSLSTAKSAKQLNEVQASEQEIFVRLEEENNDGSQTWWNTLEPYWWTMHSG
ncbi:unnamed protein product [Sphenostylis stenocarpa]|uniref:Uncharacterized protein n=1 Tax=Sphenostylis stenocarpa TaxID=92480 RepID=A0AA86S8X0_9FABA|nr:unnamed protein product [Sphenostylis stenocarpa]